MVENLTLLPSWTICPCHMRQFTGNQFQAISKKRIRSHLNIHILGIVRRKLFEQLPLCYQRVLQHAVQLVASKLPVIVISRDKALNNNFEIVISGLIARALGKGNLSLYTEQNVRFLSVCGTSTKLIETTEYCSKMVATVTLYQILIIYCKS